MAKGDFKVPFDSNGNQVRYVYHGTRKYAGIGWRDNTPFYATLKLKECHRYSHTCYVELVNNQHKSYYMMFRTFFDLVKQSASQNLPLQFEGWWRAEKIGEAYGIRAATADEVSDFLTTELAQAQLDVLS